MIGPKQPGSAFVAYADGFEGGLVGTIGVTIYDSDGNVAAARQTTGIIEVGTFDDVARYRANLVAPSASASPYLVVFDDGVDGTDSSAEELLVEVSATGTAGADTFPWIDGSDVADCLGVEYSSTTAADLDLAADIASELLYDLSGRVYQGERGPVTVRPIRDVGYSRVPLSVFLGPAYAPGPYRVVSGPTDSVVSLAGYPVREIVAVKVDGVTLATSEYRLERRRDLVRLGTVATRARNVWPVCQRVDLPDSEDGTFSVTYMYGSDVPATAVAAAKQLAGEVYRWCSIGDTTCALPSGVRTVIRQGVTIERQAVGDKIRQEGSGLTAVDLFLAAVNPNGNRRRAAVWTPETALPRRVG